MRDWRNDVFHIRRSKYAILLSREIDHEAHWSDPFRSTVGHLHLAGDWN